MMCWPKAQIGAISSLFWFGWVFTLLWMPRLGDIYGRKMPVAYVSVISFFLYLGVMFAPNIQFLGFILFVFGFFNSIRTNISYLYMIELMPKKQQS